MCIRVSILLYEALYAGENIHSDTWLNWYIFGRKNILNSLL